MDVIGAMKARRSVRSYLPRKVEQEKLNAVLEAVRLTPSRHNDAEYPGDRGTGQCLEAADPPAG